MGFYCYKSFKTLTPGEHRGRGGPAVVDHEDVSDDRRVLRRQRRRKGVHENVERSRPG
jgi:hypothetical protein